MDRSTTAYSDRRGSVIKRIAIVASAATFVMGLGLAAIASARTFGTRHRPAHGEVASAVPDQVIQWNEELQKVLVAPGAQPASIHPTRTMAITQIAVYDAVNGIVGGGPPILVDAHA